MGIQEVAAASQTIPAAVVRLAQRYGLKGFRELKLAFCDALSSAIADGAPAQALAQGSQPHPHLEGNLHVHLD